MPPDAKRALLAVAAVATLAALVARRLGDVVTQRLCAVLAVVLVAGLVLSGCASPDDVAQRRADVLADNARALSENDVAQRSAEEWNVRIAGMPASGMLAIILAALAVLAILIVCGFVYRYNINAEKLRAEREGGCAICGSTVAQRRKAHLG